MTKMPNWTRERPTEAGWYGLVSESRNNLGFCRRSPVMVVNVFHLHQSPDLPLWVNGRHFEYELSEFAGDHMRWCGPLEFPPLEAGDA